MRCILPVCMYLNIYFMHELFTGINLNKKLYVDATSRYSLIILSLILFVAIVFFLSIILCHLIKAYRKIINKIIIKFISDYLLLSLLVLAFILIKKYSMLFFFFYINI